MADQMKIIERKRDRLAKIATSPIAVRTSATASGHSSDSLGDVQHDRMKVALVGGETWPALSAWDVLKQGHSFIQGGWLVFEDLPFRRCHGAMGGLQPAFCGSLALGSGAIDSLLLSIVFGAELSEPRGKAEAIHELEELCATVARLARYEGLLQHLDEEFHGPQISAARDQIGEASRLLGKSGLRLRSGS
jgi:hypothetical protein